MSTKKMKKFKYILFACFVFYLSCSHSSFLKLKIEIPGDPQIDLEKFNQIVITNFLIQKETKDININKEIVEYLKLEIEQNFDGEVVPRNFSVENEEAYKNQDFWKGLIKASERTLFLTGVVNYSEEIRKAILEKRKDRSEDPFPADKQLAERKFYTLKVDLYLIDAQTGNPLYQRSFKETKGYKNPNQTAYFAFFDLIQQVKDKLLRNILGAKKIEERYLISR
jgi:hypothetical protein